MMRSRCSRSTRTGMPRMRFCMCSCGGPTATIRSKYGLGRMWGNTSIFMLPPALVTALYRAPLALRLQKSRPVFGGGGSMLRSAKGLMGVTIGASDGDIGEVEALIFDDRLWTARYFGVD